MQMSGLRSAKNKLNGQDSSETIAKMVSPAPATRSRVQDRNLFTEQTRIVEGQIKLLQIHKTSLAGAICLFSAHREFTPAVIQVAQCSTHQMAIVNFLMSLKKELSAQVPT